MFTRNTVSHTRTGQLPTSVCTQCQRWSAEWRKERARDRQGERECVCVCARDILRQIMLFDNEREQGVDEIGHCWLTDKIIPAGRPLACLLSRSSMFQFLLKSFQTRWVSAHTGTHWVQQNTLTPAMLSRSITRTRDWYVFDRLAGKREKAASAVTCTITELRLRKKSDSGLAKKRPGFYFQIPRIVLLKRLNLILTGNCIGSQGLLAKSYSWSLELWHLLNLSAFWNLSFSALMLLIIRMAIKVVNKKSSQRPSH